MEIQFVSRPIAPPWDSGSMNMAYGVATHLSSDFSARVPVVKGFSDVIEAVTFDYIFLSKENNLTNKLRLLKYISVGKESDLYHFFLGPSFLTKLVVSTIWSIRNQPIVLTLTHILPDSQKLHWFGSKIVTYSQYYANLLKKMGLENVSHIPPGVDTDKLFPGTIGNSIRKTLEVSEGANIILYAGEFSKSANLSALVDAAKICSEQDHNTIFILACRIRNQSELEIKKSFIARVQEEELSQKIRIYETVPNIHGLIAASNVCILPLYDTFGKVDIPIFLLEAMAFEKPIVVTDINPLRELLNSPVGFGVPVDDGEQLAAAIQEAITHQEMLGFQGRKTVLENYSLKIVANQYEKLYRELL